MDSDSVNPEDAESKGNMDLLYLLLPIIGAFLMLFVVCCCGKKVKELLHLPKEIAMGRPIRDFELQERTSRHNQRDNERNLLRPNQHGDVNTVAGGSQTLREDSITTETETEPLVHKSPATEICQRRDLSDVTEQELEALLLCDSARLRHDSGIATCSCHRSLMSVEVPMDGIRIEEEADSALVEDADAITVIPTEQHTTVGELAVCRAHLEGQMLAWSHLQSHRDHAHARKKAQNFTAKTRLHQSLCEGLHATATGVSCRCAAVHKSQLAPGRPRRTPHEDRTRRVRAEEDSRRRHLSVGSCDTAHRDVIVHVVNDGQLSDDNVFS